MTVPYAPTPFAQAIVNPSVGGFGAAFPYLSISEYKNAPTAMDTTTLVEDGDFQAQDQALFNTIRRASAWADRICFGIDPASKGASICATQSIEHAYVLVLQGELRLVCAYKPIVELSALDVGTDPSTCTPVDATMASTIRFGEKVIYVPAREMSTMVGGLRDSLPAGISASGRRYCVWSYVNGYPHSKLAAPITAASRTVTVAPTAPGGGLFGVYPGSQLTITADELTESFTVQSIAGSTMTTVDPLLYDHVLPGNPDFTPVTAIPADVGEAVIFLTTALIKTRGDNALVLAEMTEPTQIKSTVGGVNEDVALAMQMLKPFASATKVKS